MLVPLLLPQDILDIITLDGVSLDIDNGVSNLVGRQVPSFVATDHTQFVEFLKQYYEWMEFEDNPKYESNNLINYRDVDDTKDVFVKRFTSELANGIPEILASTSTDKRKMVKRMLDFYRAKGTEKSYKTFFRLLFGEEPQLYYPSNDILKLSDGRWSQPSILKVTRTMGIADIPDLVGRRVEQAGPTLGSIAAYGFVQSANHILRYDTEFIEVELSGVFGSFEAEKLAIFALTGGATVEEYIYPTVDVIGISAEGSGYKVGDRVNISGTSTGVGAEIYVGSVGPSGEIKGFIVEDTGINYRLSESLVAGISTGGGGTSAVLVVTGGASTRQTEGFWDGGQGLISSTSKLRDGNYYQEFSYVVRSTRNLEEYKESTQKMVHPAGFKQFGEYLLEQGVTVEGETARYFNQYEVPVIGHYTPYRHLTIRSLRANGTGGSGGIDLYPGGYPWRLAEGNTYYDEDDDVAPASPIFILGNSGSLGGTIHVEESIGQTSSFGPGGSANAVQGSQYAVDSAIGGTFYGPSGTITGGNYWEIYPHFSTRGIKGLAFSKNYAKRRLQIAESSDPAAGDAYPAFDDGELVRQLNPIGEAGRTMPVGEIIDTQTIGGFGYVNVKVFSGRFLNTGTQSFGATAGLLEGISSGTTAYINNITDISDGVDSSAEIGAVKLSTVLTQLDTVTRTPE